MQSAPTIVVHSSRTIPLLVLAAAGCAMSSAIGLALWQGSASRELSLVIVIALAVAVFAGQRALDRTPRLVIQAKGLDVVSQQTGLLRWDELLYVSHFNMPRGGADGLAIFITDAAARRLPPDSCEDLPALADVSVGTKYLLLWGRDLDCSVADLRDEIEARRHGRTGPLTKRAR